ncbi:MAG: vWA domain-containing protein [Chitinophagaceae bacterium]
MKLTFKLFAAITLIAGLLGIYSFKSKNHQVKTSMDKATTPAKIQVAILLDVSNSMDGLIEQAKAQLWNMVSVLGKAQNNNQPPSIEIALYEYGRSSNDVKEGYVKQISPFTADLDFLSKQLFNLTTQGGDEYCGNVIYKSLAQLNWDNSASSYKVIFIAGNEDFLQGDVLYTMACKEANKKGVIVNTIYCGDRMQGVREHWNLAGECGNGSFTNINQNEKIEEIATPHDSTLFVLNEKLNNTYIFYGAHGAGSMVAQGEVDKMNYAMSRSVAAKRVAVKGQKQLYKNSSWDLVDAADSDSTLIAKVDLKTLPANLKNKSRSELKQIVKEKNHERGTIQKEISSVNALREAYIANERAKASSKSNTATMESEIEKIIKTQAKRYNFAFE